MTLRRRDLASATTILEEERLNEVMTMSCFGRVLAFLIFSQVGLHFMAGCDGDKCKNTEQWEGKKGLGPFTNLA